MGYCPFLRNTNVEVFHHRQKSSTTFPNRLHLRVAVTIIWHMSSNPEQPQTRHRYIFHPTLLPLVEEEFPNPGLG